MSTFSEGPSTESDVLTPVSRPAREDVSECGAESYDGRSSSVYRCSKFSVVYLSLCFNLFKLTATRFIDDP